LLVFVTPPGVGNSFQVPPGGESPRCGRPTRHGVGPDRRGTGWSLIQASGRPVHHGL